jgi:hypothetical protein
MARGRPWSWRNKIKRILQGNLGKSRRAQDLLFQTIRESEVALAVIAEPYSVPDYPNWVGDLEGSTAIGWTTTTTSSAPGALLDRGNGYIAVEWAGIVVVGVYVPSNSGLDSYGRSEQLHEKKMPLPSGAHTGGLQRPFLAVGRHLYKRTGKDAVRLGRGPRAPANQQGLNEHVRSMEGFLCGRYHVDHCQPAPTDTQLESG